MLHRKALFAGSFDPYTNGHHALVRKAAALFDEVIVLIGVNVHKRRTFDAEAMQNAIQQVLDDDGLDARAVIYDGLVTEYCARNGIHWYVRGLRSQTDYIYEENAAQINRLLEPMLETVYLRGEDIISSSMVRELLAFGQNVGAFVPEPVLRLIEESENR